MRLRPRAEGTLLSRWLYEEIRAAIQQGRLAPGSKLPSKSAIARNYRLSRGTVVTAFERLIGQGYLDSTVGSGTYVRATCADALPEDAAQRARALAKVPRRTLSTRGRGLAAQAFPKLWSERSVETFRLDRPALDAFPIQVWKELVDRHLHAGARELADHGEPLGFAPLRAAIAGYVGDSQGIRCGADQVVITSGTQQSLDLIARLLLDRGDQVWMEDPGYPAATSLFRAYGAQVIGVPTDRQGLDCDAGRQRAHCSRLAYVTPACQFPLGAAMSEDRRTKVLQWAEEAGAWIFEDDFDSQMQCGDRPTPALYSLDRAGSVIYSNSFNRSLFPSLRLGFLILPPAFIEPAAAALSITRRYGPTLEQAVLADFIVQGHLALHVRRMREIYRARREALLTAGKSELDGLMRLSDASGGGLHVVGWLARGLSEAEVWRRAAANRISSIALSTLTIERRMPPALVLGIGSADERSIRTAVKRLRRVLRGVLLSSSPRRRAASEPRQAN
jgi:GntR family transcriptional regulator / MocR family aminotransferase